MREIQDITGEVFGHLTVVGYSHTKKHKSYYECRCDCGKTTYVTRQNLTSGKTQSCGHLRAESVKMHRVGREQFHKVELNERQINWLFKHYCHTKNAEIKEKLGITDGWLHRFAREHGLTKTPQFMKKCQADTTAKAKESHIKNGTYPPKGYRIPRSEEFGFKPGETSEMRLGKKKNRERIEKSTESMRKTRKLERARISFGLEQRTKLRLTRQNKNVVSLRHNLRKRGYIIETGSMVAYYDGNTRRSMEIENRKLGDKNYVAFKFMERQYGIDH